MICKRKNKIPRLQLNNTAFLLFLVMQLFGLHLFAQEPKVATLKLSFSQTDSTKTCIATLLSDSLPVKETEVHLYVKGLYTLLPVGKVVSTDENGEASFEFPTNLPSSKKGMLDIVAKVEKNEIYGNVETQSSVKWGVTPVSEVDWANRSLSASREKAPMTLVVVSTLIIVLIWGTIFYIISQLFVIKKSGRVPVKLNVAEG
jgi:hypothetical protein